MATIEMDKIAINVVVERERRGSSEIFIASSPEINVFAEGKTIDEAIEKFRAGVKFHLENFPEEKNALLVGEEDRFEMPLVTRMFL